jgi:hypothetical protein
MRRGKDHIHNGLMSLTASQARKDKTLERLDSGFERRLP